MKDKKSNVANLLEAQWVRGKTLPRGHRGTRWKKAPNDCDHPPTAIQKGGNAVMYYERCEMCGNRWQRIPLTMVARDPETKLNNRTVLASTGKRAVEIERRFLSTRTREHDDAGHAAAEPLLGMLDVQYNLCTQPGPVRRAPGGPGELRGCRREHGSHWGQRDTVPLKVQGQLKGVDQKTCIQLICETGQCPGRQIATLELVPGKRTEMRQQVTESFCVLDGLLN